MYPIFTIVIALVLAIKSQSEDQRGLERKEGLTNDQLKTAFSDFLAFFQFEHICDTQVERDRVFVEITCTLT